MYVFIEMQRDKLNYLYRKLGEFDIKNLKRIHKSTDLKSNSVEKNTISPETASMKHSEHLILVRDGEKSIAAAGAISLTAGWTGGMAQVQVSPLKRIVLL